MAIHKSPFCEEYENEEPCCPTPKIVLNDDSYFVCLNCGCVHRREYCNSERRAYSLEEINNRRRTEPKWRSYGSRTVIGNVSQDGRGNHLLGKKAALFNRLNKIQSSLVNSLERNFWEARPKIMSLINKMNLPNFMQETAWKIYTFIAKKKLTMGRSIDAFCAASIYAAIRIHDFPRLLEEVAEVSMIPTRGIHKALGMIVQKILPELNLRYKPLGPEPLVYRFGNELSISMILQKRANDLLKYASRNGLRRLGKDPKGLAAASIYLVARNSEERRTQSQIAQIARITEVTLRTRAKQLLLYVKRAVPPTALKVPSDLK